MEPGESVVLDVAVSSINSGMLTYSWRKDGQSISGVMGPQCSTVPYEQNMYYRCMVSDGYGKTSYFFFNFLRNNELTVNGNFQERTIDPGKSVEMKVNVITIDMLSITYEWFRQTSDEDGFTYFEPVGNIVGNSFTVENVTSYKKYRRAVGDGYNGEFLNTFVDFEIIIKNDIRVFGSGTESNEVTIHVSVGEDVSLKVDVSGENSENAITVGNSIIVFHTRVIGKLAS